MKHHEEVRFTYRFAEDMAYLTPPRSNNMNERQTKSKGLS